LSLRRYLEASVKHGMLGVVYEPTTLFNLPPSLKMCPGIPPPFRSVTVSHKDISVGKERQPCPKGRK